MVLAHDFLEHSQGSTDICHSREGQPLVRKEEAGSKKDSGGTGFGAALGVVGQRAYVG